MAERVYTSRGLVVRKGVTGEGSLSVLVYTEGYGLLRVHAQGARLLKGKLRFGLEPFTRAVFSFVLGKNGARLIGIEGAQSLLPQRSIAGRRILGNIGRLITRLMPGEVGDAALFARVIEGCEAVAGTSEEMLPALECVVVLSLLSHLGYLPSGTTLASYATEPITTELLDTLVPERSTAVREINKILIESGL